MSRSNLEPAIEETEDRPVLDDPILDDPTLALDALAFEAQAEAGAPSAQPLNIKVLLAYLFCATAWGTTWFAIRVSVGEHGFPIYQAAFLRFLGTWLLLYGLWRAFKGTQKGPSFAQAKWISLAGLLSGASFALLYTAEQQISGGLAAVICATSPLMTALCGWVAKIERPTKASIIGSLIALSGVAVVFHDRLQISQAQALSALSLVMVSVVNGICNVTMKKHAQNVAVLASNAVFFGTSAVLFGFACLSTKQYLLPQPLELAPSMAVLYLIALGTPAFLAYYYLLKHVRLSTAASLSFVVPVVALAADAVLEKQCVLTMESMAGIAVVLAGVALSVLAKR